MTSPRAPRAGRLAKRSAGEGRPSAAAFAERLAVAYLAVPLVIWLVGWFQPLAGLPAAALLVAGLWGPLSGSWRVPKPSRTVVVAALAALAVTLVSPAGGLFLVEGDWMIRRGIFLDLAQGGWPTYLAGPLDEPVLLRYYMGWHMAPALVARAAGIASLNWAVPLWTWFGTSLAAVLFVRRFPTVRAAALALAVLFLFSGADVADNFLRAAIEQIAQSPRGVMLEYLSHQETLRFSPQHFMPAALGSLLLIRARGRPHRLSMAAVVLATCLFWSPFVTAGLAPLAAVAVAGPGRRLRPLGWTGALATVPAVALTALYLAGGNVDFLRAWLWESWDGPWHLAFRLAALYATEFLVLAWLLVRTDGRTSHEPFLLAAVCVLLAAPLYHYGNGISEWSARVHIPAVFVLSYYAARAVATRLPEMAGHAHLRSRAAWWALAALLVVGAGPVVRDFKMSRWRPLPYQLTGESLSLDTAWWFVRQQTAPHLPAPLVAALRSPGPARRQPMALLIRAGYDVYLDGIEGEAGTRLVYAKRDCDWEADGSWLFLEVRYAPSADLRAPSLRRPPWDNWELSAANGREERLRLRLRRRDNYSEGRGCIAIARFGGGPVESIRTGQYGPGGRLLWAVERGISGGVLVARSAPAATSR